MMLAGALPAAAFTLPVAASGEAAAGPAGAAEGADFMGLLLLLAGIGTSPLPPQAWGAGSDSDWPPTPPTRQREESVAPPLDAAAVGATGMPAWAGMPVAVPSTPSEAVAPSASDDPPRSPASALGDVAACATSTPSAPEVHSRLPADDLAPGLRLDPGVQIMARPAAGGNALRQWSVAFRSEPAAGSDWATSTATGDATASDAPAQARRINAALPELARDEQGARVERGARAVKTADASPPAPDAPLPPAPAGSPAVLRADPVSEPALTTATENIGQAGDASGTVATPSAGAREPGEAARPRAVATGLPVPVLATEPTVGAPTSLPERPASRATGQTTPVRRSASRDSGEETVSPSPFSGLEPRPGDRRVGLPAAALLQSSERDRDSAGDHERADADVPHLPAIEAGAVVNTAARSPVAPVASRPPATEPRIVDQVVRAARLVVSEGVSRLEVQLEPPALGAIRVTAAESREGIRLTISAEQSDTRALLLSALPEIQSALAGRGLASANVVVAHVFEDQTGLPARRREAEREPASGRSRPDRRREDGDSPRPTATVNYTV
jgi:flagellar hook-length control protein FliK